VKGARASSGLRIRALGVGFGAALVVVLAHLWVLMVRDQEVWARRSYENRWAFRSVPSLRGRVLDARGQVLAQDEPTTRVSLHYLRFRLRHCVGAAVHGATVCKRLEPGYEQVRYGYQSGDYGPRQAARDLLSMPVQAIEPGVLPKKVTSQLATYATTVLSQVGEVTRRQAYRAMREAAQSGARLGIGDVLDAPRAALLVRFDERLRELQELGRRLYEEQLAAADRRGVDAKQLKDLMQRLEELRDASFRRLQVTWKDDFGEEQTGSYLEELRTPIADEVSFDVAAVLRVDSARHAGVFVEPSVRRRVDVREGTALHALLGRVNWLDRTAAQTDRMQELLTGEVPRTWIERYMDERMPGEWAEELVPEGLVADEARLLMIEEARRRYRRELMTRERRGVTGAEAWFNDELMGQLGMRFVEHDGKRREQALWSHLRVESGVDVQLTLDARLQEIAEAAVQATWRGYRGGYEASGRPDKAEKVEAAIALIDANSGDVLAFAGAPIVTDNARHVPGVMWVGNGSIGSVAKPFVLVDYLESARLGREHLPLGDVEACQGYYDSPFVRMRLRCGSAHWQAGSDPRAALAKSCNCFFYQVGEGLGEAGVGRAYRRFGLVAPDGAGDPHGLCWQEELRGVSVARGSVDMKRPLPSRSIGYGLQVSPVYVARAYAGLATGVLPTLGIRLGEERDRVRLDVAEESLEVVRAGLRDVLTRGTGRGLVTLRDLGASGKTGTAELTSAGDNNAWFAGYLPGASAGGVRLAFCAVVYFVPDSEHGAEAAGGLLESVLRQVARDPELSWRYLPR
jgi:cell division protein FtsI/penicillin-binding protein 2